MGEETTETVLLQVQAQVAHRTKALDRLTRDSLHQVPAQVAQAPMQSCYESLCGKKEYLPYEKDELFGVVVEKWDWLTAYCKMENKWTNTAPGAGACLWKGCLAEGNLIKGANEYVATNPWNADEADYCFQEHCNNAQFDLHTTTPAQAQQYCDGRFGKTWRQLTAGPDGRGWPNEQPGSGVWECAHNNYHCDWAYCKLHYCNKPELLTLARQKEKYTEALGAMEPMDPMERYSQGQYNGAVGLAAHGPVDPMEQFSQYTGAVGLASPRQVADYSEFSMD